MWVSVREAARRLSVSPKTIRRRIQKGELKRRNGLVSVGEDAQERIEQNEALTLSKHYVYNKENDTYITFLKSAPKPVVLSGADHRALVEAYSNWDGQPATINQIAQKFTIPRNWLTEYLRNHGITHDREPFPAEKVLEQETDVLVEEALETRRASLARKYEVAKWKQTQKEAEQWREIERGVLPYIQEAIRESRKNVPSIQPILPEAPRPYALVVHPTDLHVGKLGPDYDLDEARRRLQTATEDLLGILARFGAPERFLTSCGGDWFQADTPSGTTTRGTPQDMAATFEQTVYCGFSLQIAFLEALAQVAPVQAVVTPGNHDRAVSTVMGIALEHMYKDHDRIQVGYSPHPRSCIEYGKNLIMMTHGDGAKTEDYPSLMAVEVPESWGRCPYRYAYHGHLHHERIREIRGVSVTQMPSLTGSDRFHLHEGYVGNNPRLAGYAHDYERGRFAIFSAAPSAV